MSEAHDDLLAQEFQFYLDHAGGIAPGNTTVV